MDMKRKNKPITMVMTAVSGGGGEGGREEEGYKDGRKGRKARKSERSLVLHLDEKGERSSEGERCLERRATKGATSRSIAAIFTRPVLSPPPMLGDGVRLPIRGTRRFGWDRYASGGGFM
jgi:hypothetical protein